MNTLQANLINTGAAIMGKDGLYESPIDAILDMSAQPTGTGTVLTSPIVPSVPRRPRASRIGAVGSSTGDSNKTGLIVVAGLGALLLFSKEGKKVLGIGKKKKEKKSKTSMLPLLLAGGGVAAYFFLNNKSANPFPNDPEIKDLVRQDGVLRLSPTQYAAKSARAQTWNNTKNEWYEGIYHDVLVTEIPNYKSALDVMSLDELMTLYHFVQDTGPNGLTPADPTYNALIAIRDKYKLPFY